MRDFQSDCANIRNLFLTAPLVERNLVNHCYCLIALYCIYIYIFIVIYIY